MKTATQVRFDNAQISIQGNRAQVGDADVWEPFGIGISDGPFGINRSDVIRFV